MESVSFFQDPLAWISQNREWLFSGAGLELFSGLIGLLCLVFGIKFFRKKRKGEIKAQGEANPATIDQRKYEFKDSNIGIAGDRNTVKEVKFK